MSEFLVISPHVDDEVLGCGGILDKRFHVHYCGVEDFRIIDREKRLEEARTCSEFLGFSFSINDKNQVNHYAVPDLVGQIEKILNQLQPHTVFLPCPSYNQDHRAVLDAGLVALRPHDKNHQVENVLIYEQVHANVWPYREDLLSGKSFCPNYFVPVDIERKLSAYQLQASQVRDMRPPDIVKLLARWRGFQAGFDYAEGFSVIRMTTPARLVLGKQKQLA